jgi:sulfopyruvate decarboxylase TPP-binding subunit
MRRKALLRGKRLKKIREHPEISEIPVSQKSGGSGAASGGALRGPSRQGFAFF